MHLEAETAWSCVCLVPTYIVVAYRASLPTFPLCLLSPSAYLPSFHFRVLRLPPILFFLNFFPHSSTHTLRLALFASHFSSSTFIVNTSNQQLPLSSGSIHQETREEQSFEMR